MANSSIYPEPHPMHDVMISYSSIDKNIADAICNHLESNGIRVWMAPRDILSGESYTSAVLAGIINCKIIVLVFSNHSNQSKWVPKELERGVHYGKIIIPFIIEQVRPVSTDIEFCISTQHWLDAMTPPLEKSILKLVDAIKALTSKDETSAGKDQHASLSPLGEIYQMAKRWRENDYAYFVLEGMSDELKSILRNTPKSIEIEDETILLFMMIASLHYGGNWIYWQNKLANDEMIVRQLLKLLDIGYVRPRLRALYALQGCDTKYITGILAQSGLDKDDNLMKIFAQYVYTKSFVSYLEHLADSNNTGYQEKAKMVLGEIGRYSKSSNDRPTTDSLPLISSDF